MMIGDSRRKIHHVKLLAFDFLSLKPHHSSPSSFLLPRNGNGIRSVSQTETLGVVVSRDRKDRFLRFHVDDGTGCVPCILWLNHFSPNNYYYARMNRDDLELLSDAALEMADSVQLGRLVRVRGRVSLYRGCLQSTVSNVRIEEDPNSETLHWLQSMRLATCKILPPPPSTAAAAASTSAN